MITHPTKTPRFASLGFAIALCLGTFLSANSAEITENEKQAAKAGLTSEAVQAAVTKKEAIQATGVGSAPKSATVTFESIRFGEPRKTNERDRLVNGITGPLAYPVRVKYTSHRVWGNGETEDKTIHYDYEFFKNSFGDWDTYMVGPVNG